MKSQKQLRSASSVAEYETLIYDPEPAIDWSEY